MKEINEIDLYNDLVAILKGVMLCLKGKISLSHLFCRNIYMKHESYFMLLIQYNSFKYFILSLE